MVGLNSRKAMRIFWCRSPAVPRLAKERLLNLALKSVPPAENHIAWVDCDVIFERRDWMHEAEKQLSEFNVVQLLSHQVDLNPEDHHTNFEYRHTPSSGQGIVSMVTETKAEVLPTPGPNRRSFAWGLAWAARREILQGHGLYDAMVVGGGTRALVSAMYGEFDRITEAFQLTPARREHYLDGPALIMRRLTAGSATFPAAFIISGTANLKTATTQAATRDWWISTSNPPISRLAPMVPGIGPDQNRISRNI